MSVFAALLLVAAISSSAAIVLYLYTGFTQRCAPIPLTVISAWAAWDGMQVFGLIRPWPLVYYVKPGFIILYALFLYLYYTHRARHYPGISTVRLVGYALAVMTISGASIAGINHLLGDPGGSTTVGLVALLFPALIVIGRGELRPGQHPLAAILYTVTFVPVLAAIVLEPPPGSHPAVNAVIYGCALVLSCAYTLVVLANQKPRRSLAHASSALQPGKTP
ncbi:hypothetical protein [Streptomyces spectabilis]|uniref:Uncharacterized protein n=1 Tax=Streptomyces spectabilis TaxID=68270 RepID=A0A7W8F002_STRST|nr:hypothetical protein [Streptomyces spectabilis]MBB5109933.1 hypothetical protein [Streptomyces spectabilis]GGV55946.1 hypothetical protein GCM10010245_88730 [Streptomyces spectabilis]